MCKNLDIDIPNNSNTVEHTNDYSEISTYDRDDMSDYSDYSGIPKDLLESIGQAIIDASENDDENEESSIYCSRTESSDDDDDDD